MCGSWLEEIDGGGAMTHDMSLRDQRFVLAEALYSAPKRCNLPVGREIAAISAPCSLATTYGPQTCKGEAEK